MTVIADLRKRHKGHVGVMCEELVGVIATHGFSLCDDLQWIFFFFFDKKSSGELIPYDSSLLLYRRDSVIEICTTAITNTDVWNRTCEIIREVSSQLIFAASCSYHQLWSSLLLFYSRERIKRRRSNFVVVSTCELLSLLVVRRFRDCWLAWLP